MAWARGEKRDPNTPEEGFFAVRLVKKGVECGAKLVLRGETWTAYVNEELTGTSNDNAVPGVYGPIERVWLFGRRIDQAEYYFLIARYRHAKEHDPESVFANPDRPINFRLMKPIGGKNA